MISYRNKIKNLKIRKLNYINQNNKFKNIKNKMFKKSHY